MPRGLQPSPGSPSLTHIFPPSNLPWHKRVIHWCVHILVLDINRPYLCTWWQLPGLLDFLPWDSHRCCLHKERLWCACLSLKPSFFGGERVGVRGEGPDEEGGGRKTIPGSMWPWDPGLWVLTAAWPRNTQASYLPTRLAPHQARTAWPWGEGRSRTKLVPALGSRWMVICEASSWFDFLLQYHIFFLFYQTSAGCLASSDQSHPTNSSDWLA